MKLTYCVSILVIMNCRLVLSSQKQGWVGNDTNLGIITKSNILFLGFDTLKIIEKEDLLFILYVRRRWIKKEDAPF